MSADIVREKLDDLFGDEFAPMPAEGGAFDLAPLRAALSALGDPHKRLPKSVHVAGTNGKGSTIAFMQAIADAAGISAHVFSKPHLFKVNERIRLGGALATDYSLLSAIDRVHATGARLRHFEAQVAAALLLFAEHEGDLLLLETGVGGLEDATNVIAQPALSLITPVDFDHAALLGDSLEEIAAHKAGILKPGAPAIIARQRPQAAAIIEAHAAELGAPLLRQGVEWDCYNSHGRLAVQTDTRLLDLPAPALFGAHQFDNAGAAVVAMLTLGDQRIDERALARGVAQAFLPARMQRASHTEREIWIDGAHNPHGARALAAAIAALNSRAPKRTILILGIRPRKDAAAFLEALGSCGDALIATPISGVESLPADALRAMAKRRDVEAAASLDEAFVIATRDADARIVVCGSLALAAEALAQIAG
ncbi:MAG: folylpolyglutamate synthase/dihydrofolate synthase family protein [Hyphomonadaceae bacterium]